METGEIQRPRRRRIEDVLVVGNKEAARRLLAEGVGGEGGDAVIERLVAPDVIAYDVAFPQPIKGLTEYRDNVGRYRAAFPDLRVDVDQVLGEGNDVSSAAGRERRSK